MPQNNHATPESIITALKKANEEKNTIIDNMAEANTELWSTISQLHLVINEAMQIMKNALKKED